MKFDFYGQVKLQTSTYESFFWFVSCYDVCSVEFDFYGQVKLQTSTYERAFSGLPHVMVCALWSLTFMVKSNFKRALSGEYFLVLLSISFTVLLQLHQIGFMTQLHC